MVLIQIIIINYLIFEETGEISKILNFNFIEEYKTVLISEFHPKCRKVKNEIFLKNFRVHKYDGLL